MRGLGGDAAAMRELVEALLPVVHARVTRSLWRSRRRSSTDRDAQQEVDDLTQDVFAALFADNARALRAWDPARGASLLNFVGLIAEREVSALLRTGRRSPWTEDPTLDEHLFVAAGASEGLDLHVMSQDLLAAVLERLRERLSPRGMYLFQALVVEERLVEELADELDMTPAAIYAWRTRFVRTARAILVEVAPPSRPNEPRGGPAQRNGATK